MFHGSMVAIITPMKKNGELDEVSLKKLVEMHVNAGTRAIIVAGTTGESATLTHEEKLKVIKLVVKLVDERIPVIAGTGTNSTAVSIELTLAAMHTGVDACLIVTPYYNKPTQEGLFLHYQSIAHAAAIPIILYNVPGRTCCDLLPETVARLAHVPNIIGIKEATGDVKRTQEIIELCGDGLDVYSGDDITAKDLMFAGAKGVISVTANVAPRLMNEMCQAALSRNQQLANELDEKLIGLHKALFVESNPIPTKWVLKEMGLCEEGIRLPLTPLSEHFHDEIRMAMLRAGID